MTLKTLKDCYMSDGRNYEQRLKEEALTWYKHLIMTGEDNVFDFLETFFGLTEEDLK